MTARSSTGFASSAEAPSQNRRPRRVVLSSRAARWAWRGSHRPSTLRAGTRTAARAPDDALGGGRSSGQLRGARTPARERASAASSPLTCSWCASRVERAAAVVADSERMRCRSSEKRGVRHPCGDVEMEPRTRPRRAVTLPADDSAATSRGRQHRARRDRGGELEGSSSESAIGLVPRAQHSALVRRRASRSRRCRRRRRPWQEQTNASERGGGGGVAGRRAAAVAVRGGELP